VEQDERRPADLDARQIAVRVGDDEILVSWHAPSLPPEGQAHGAEGICVTGTGDVVVISRDGRRWDYPPGDRRATRPGNRPFVERFARKRVRPSFALASWASPVASTSRADRRALCSFARSGAPT
jgi:hypothetical protein